MLTIQNENKLTGRELWGSGPDGPVNWHVSGIGKHMHHYIIYLTRNDNGFERKVKLDRNHSPKMTGYQYKLQCGNEIMYLDKSNIKNIDIFSNQLESFL